MSDRTGNGSTTLRRYVARDDKGRWLGTFVIADDGYFSTVSDYGNYAFYWSHAGPCFRRFLAQLGADYLCSKLGRSDHYDGGKTEQTIKRSILQLRRSGSLSREDAREEWDHLLERNVDSREEFAIWYQGTKLQDAHEMTHSDYAPDLRGFASTAWPAFAKVLREDLATERLAPVVDSPPERT